eukprot:2072706-Amphidinium_carterae.1
MQPTESRKLFAVAEEDLGSHAIASNLHFGYVPKKSEVSQDEFPPSMASILGRETFPELLSLVCLQNYTEDSWHVMVPVAAAMLAWLSVDRFCSLKLEQLALNPVPGKNCWRSS